MTNTATNSLMPHHRLRAYGVAVDLLQAVRAARIRDRVLSVIEPEDPLESDQPAQAG